VDNLAAIRREQDSVNFNDTSLDVERPKLHRDFTDISGANSFGYLRPHVHVDVYIMQHNTNEIHRQKSGLVAQSVNRFLQREENVTL
jgi:hypothetical protein